MTENASGGAPKPLYIDGDKYSNLSAPEEYEATLTAYTYPDEFEPCDGTAIARPGLLATRQKRMPFGLSYRTRVGNDLTTDANYKIHLVYNAMAAPSNRAYKSIGENADAVDFSWKITATPPPSPGYKRTAHVILDSETMSPQVLSAAEDILYGTDSTLSRLPSLVELIDLVDTNATLTVVDHGDGTFSVTAPMSMLKNIDSSTFQLNSGVTIVDSNTYSVSSP